MVNNELNVQIPQNLDPVYSNMIQIAFKDDEFTMIFLHHIPVGNQAKAKSIVAISPIHAKKLLAALQKSVNEYEAKFGHISVGAHGPENDTSTLQGYS
ncbi:MAG TPA: DUF3467 domain-containing protein [Methanocorpusculum sp.]|nr:DUF3467 domain-containing protein [Methanocorpusculum sp.]